MRILSYIFIFLTFGSFAQQVSFQLTFVDGMTSSFIDSVQLSIRTSSNQTLIQKWTENNTIISINLPDDQRVKVKIQKSGYFQLDTLVDLSAYQRYIKNGLLIPLSFNLLYDGQFSHGIDITATYKPEIAFSSEKISVSDYVVINEQSMVLLAYPKRLNASSELILFENGNVVSRRNVPGTAIRLDTDYRNRIYLRCEYTDYLLSSDAALSLVKVPREQLNNYVQPILDTLRNDQLFFTTYKSHYPAFDFYNVDLKDTSNAILHHIEDTEMMEHYRAEYKWADVRTKLWAWDMEAETGIDREIWVGANVYSNSIYYEAPYSEFFLINDTAYVFDFYKDLLYTYNPHSGVLLDSTAIYFHKDARITGWEKRMYQDPITKKVYTFFNDAGYTDVYEINRFNGNKLDKFTLFYRYVENIQIFNNEVYYVYRPFESLQKKYLYKEGFMDTKRSLAGQERFNQIIR